MPRSFLRPGFPPAANFATAPRGVDFDAWPPVFEYTSVSSTRMLTSRPDREDVVQAAEPDVVGPTVAAEAPNALANEIVGPTRSDALASVAADLRQAPPQQLNHAGPLLLDDLLVVFLVRIRAALVTSSSPIWELRRPQEHVGSSCICWSTANRKPKPNSALSSKSELDHDGPLPFTGDRGVRRARQVAAVNRRAAGRVADQHAIAEQLREQLDVRRFTAAGAGAGELEQRQQELRPLDRIGF